MTHYRWTSSDRISGIELAEIQVLVLVKEAAREDLQRVLDSKRVDTLEELDPRTARNFLHYLRSL